VVLLYFVTPGIGAGALRFPKTCFEHFFKKNVEQNQIKEDVSSSKL